MIMFKGKVRVYKNVNGTDVSFKKTFDNEKDFNHFVENNPDLKQLKNWEEFKLPAYFLDLNNMFEEAYKLEKNSFFDDLEMDFKNLYDKSKKLLGK